MHRRQLILLGLLLTGVLLCVPAFLLRPVPVDAEIRVLNQSGRTIVSLRVDDPLDSSGPLDVLAGPASLPSGSRAVFRHSGRGCDRVLVVDFQEGRTEERALAGACRGVDVEFIQADPGRTSNPSFTLRNRGTAPMTAFQVRASGSGDVPEEWSPDRLRQPLDPGGARPVYLRGGHCTYDLRAMFGEETVVRQGVDVCSTASVPLP